MSASKLLCLFVCLLMPSQQGIAQENIPSVDATASTSVLQTKDFALAVERLRVALPQPWQVETNGHEILVKYPRPVGFVSLAYQINAPEITSEQAEQRRQQEIAKTLHAQVCVFKLQFQKRMPLAEYERLSSACEKKREQLESSVRQIPHKFDDYLPQNEEDRQLLVSYRRGVDDLAKQILPDLYTEQHSILLSRSWSALEAVADQEVAAQVNAIEQSLLRMFSVYDPVVQRKGRALGKYAATNDARYRVATVLGQGIYRCQVTPTQEWRQQRQQHLQEKGETSGLVSEKNYRKNQLGKLILEPLFAEFRKEQKIELTDGEIEAYVLANRRFREQKKETPRRQRTPEQEQFFARWFLGNWKLQQGLYRKYGGRVIWQQVGLEAIDGMRDFLQECEQQGKFSIDDPADAKVFWEPFTRENLSFTVADPAPYFSGDWKAFFDSQNRSEK